MKKKKSKTKKKKKKKKKKNGRRKIRKKKVSQVRSHNAPVLTSQGRTLSLEATVSHHL